MNIKCLTRILEELQPTRSGIAYEFDVSANEIVLKNSPRVHHQDSIALFELSQKAEVGYEEFSQHMSYDEYMKLMIEETRALQDERYVGGLGITSRTLAETEEMMPGISGILGKERGKMAFIGNGLSTAVLDFTSLSFLVRLETAPMIVDMFDYKTVFKDITMLRDVLRKNGMIDKKIESHTLSAEKLVKSIDDERIRAVRYFFGSRNIPRRLLDCSTVINCLGPSVSSLDEQLSMLRVGGKLYTPQTSYEESLVLTKDKAFIQKENHDMTVYERIK